MPTYEYECKKCGHHFELFQQMSDRHIKKCPKCSSPVRRLIGSGAGVIFKGSGFYQNDYKNKSSKDRPSCPKKNKNNPSCGSCGASDNGGKR